MIVAGTSMGLDKATHLSSVVPIPVQANNLYSPATTCTALPWNVGHILECSKSKGLTLETEDGSLTCWWLMALSVF